MKTQSLELLARIGYGARGAVYLLIGGLAVAASIALGGGRATGSKGALSSLSGDPLGTAALLAVGLGLLGFSLWRFVQALMDADRHGKSAKALAVRGGLLVSGIAHMLLGFYAVSLAFGYGAGGSEDGSQGAAGWVMQQPFGRYLLGAVALAILGAGAAQIRKGWSGRFRDHLAMTASLEEKLSPICAFGLIARGVTFAIIGSFFAYAAFTVDPDQAGGLESALHWVRAQSYGGALFAVVAAGLLAFGIYGLIEAVWRKIESPTAERWVGDAKRATRRTTGTLRR